ncbi:MAG: ribbon-helix-helix domain-containing protein [Candidatus Heimdallarchaeota archaeon]
MHLITVWIPEYFLECLHELVRIGLYSDRSACIRTAIRDLLKNELKGFSRTNPESVETHGCSKCGKTD